MPKASVCAVRLISDIADVFQRNNGRCVYGRVFLVYFFQLDNQLNKRVVCLLQKLQEHPTLPDTLCPQESSTHPCVH